MDQNNKEDKGGLGTLVILIGLSVFFIILSIDLLPRYHRWWGVFWFTFSTPIKDSVEKATQAMLKHAK
jgi:hypothetical protein